MSTTMEITNKLIEHALKELSARDKDILRALEEVGYPPARISKPGFGTLMGIIIGQQISAEAATAIRTRLEKASNSINPEGFLALDDFTLKTVGLSNRKIEYGRNLARKILSGDFDSTGLTRMSEEGAIKSLMRHKGIGRWSAKIYLLFALGQADVWPAEDLAVAVAVQKLKGLHERPSLEEMEAIAEPWRPWRGIVALLMWKYYRGAPLNIDNSTSK